MSSYDLFPEATPDTAGAYWTEVHEPGYVETERVFRHRVDVWSTAGDWRPRGIQIEAGDLPGCGTTRRYGFFASQPSGNFFFASSSVSEEAMMTSWPCFQSTGVATE